MKEKFPYSSSDWVEWAIGKHISSINSIIKYFVRSNKDYIAKLNVKISKIVSNFSVFPHVHFWTNSFDVSI
jgi:hypothetical protein